MQRAIRFERECLALAAGQVTEHPLGRWLSSAAHPRMWALNQLYVEGPHPSLTAEALVAELDRGLAGAPHRRAIVTDDATGRQVADGMRAAGYGVSPLAVMLLDREPPEAPADGPVSAREVDEETMRALEARIVESDPELPAEDVPVILEGHAHMRAAIPGTRCFAGTDGGTDACRVFLYTDGATAQPEDVATLPGHRGRGVAAAAVGLATREALTAGCEMVFILCHAATGPVALYADLGYRVCGRMWTFNRRA